MVIFFTNIIACQPLQGKNQYILKNADLVKYDIAQNDTITTLIGNVDVVYDSIRFLADNARLFKRRKKIQLMGKARALDDSLRAGAEQVTYDYKGKVLSLKDSAYFKEVTKDSVKKSVKAEEIEYFKLREFVKAKGNIRAKDFLEKVMLNCGDFRYHRKSGYGSAKIEPILKFQEPNEMTISSKQMEIFAEQEKLTATYDVNIEMKNSFAKGKFLIYFNQNNKSVLLGEPQFESETADAAAKEFVLYFIEDKLDSLVISKDAKIFFEHNKTGKKSNFLVAQTVKLDFMDEKLFYMNADNVKKSFIKENNIGEDGFYINRLKTKFLEVFFDSDENIDKVTARENIEATYLFEQNEK